MRFLISIIFLAWINSSAFGQISHTIEITPTSVWFNKAPSLAHGISYTLKKNDNALTIASEGTIFSQLDSRRNYNAPNDQSKETPLLNRTEMVYRRKLFENTHHNGLKTRSLEINAGYFYFQHGSQAPSEFWQIDTLPNNGLVLLSGFQTHNAKIGVTWSSRQHLDNKKNDQLLKSGMRFELNYLFGANIRLKGYSITESLVQSTEIPNSYSFDRHGAQFAFHYFRHFNEALSWFVTTEINWMPAIYYTPNYDLFVPRGGERIYPFFSSLKFGLALHKNYN